MKKDFKPNKKNFSKDDLKTIGSICVSLLTLCSVITIQMINGFQKDAGSLLLIILSLTSTFLFLLVSFKNENSIRREWNWKQKTSFGVIILIGFLFICIGLYENQWDKEVKFDYPVDGNPVPLRVSLSGEYRNINNNTESVWMYTYSNNYFLEHVDLFPLYPGSKKGTWMIKNSNIGSRLREDEGNSFTLGFIVVPLSEDDNFAKFAFDFREHGNNYLPTSPNSNKLNYNITVFRLYTDQNPQ